MKYIITIMLASLIGCHSEKEPEKSYSTKIITIHGNENIPPLTDEKTRVIYFFINDHVNMDSAHGILIKHNELIIVN